MRGCRQSTGAQTEVEGPAPTGLRKRLRLIRIDSVHQGDRDGIKGLYPINAVDCVTQWQVVATVRTISVAHLLPVIEQMLHYSGLQWIDSLRVADLRPLQAHT